MAIDLANIDLWGQDIPWLSGLREKACSAWQKTPWPNAKTEAWKYSFFPQQAFNDLSVDTKSHHCDENCHCHGELTTPFAAYGIKFCNGRLATEHFNLPTGVTIKPLVEAIFDNEAKIYLNKNFKMENFPFATLNTALLENGIVLIVERGTIIDKPIFIAYYQHDTHQNLNNIRNIFIIEKEASATIVEYYEGDNQGRYLNNVVNEIYVRASAQLKHYIWNKEATKAHHIALNAVQVRQNGQYKAFVAQSPCALSRHETYIELLQEGAQAQVNGVYRLPESGTSDITTNIRHLAAHTTSNQLIRGVVDGTARGVFQGQIHIAPDSQQCEGYQQHRALLLSDEAEIDAKPELEIFADDVKCAHGNTCGDLDVEQLFYMQTRGIALDDARQILISAHLNEALNTINNDDVKNWLLENF